MQLTKLKGGISPKYRLEEDYDFVFEHKGKMAEFTIPSGFEYDGATGGSLLFTRRSMHEHPVTLAHDWGYYKVGKVGARYQDLLGRPNGHSFDLSKKFLDDIFLQALRRDVNVQSWRDRIASGAFKTIAHLFWWRNLWRRN